VQYPGTALYLKEMETLVTTAIAGEQGGEKAFSNLYLLEAQKELSPNIKIF
jgi:hypothetical protein